MLGQREGHKSEEGPLMIGGHVTFPEGHSGGHVSVCVCACVCINFCFCYAYAIAVMMLIPEKIGERQSVAYF